MTDDTRRERVATAWVKEWNKNWPHEIENDADLAHRCLMACADAAIKAMEEPEEVSVVEQVAEALADAELVSHSLSREDKIRIGIEAIREGASQRMRVSHATWCDDDDCSCGQTQLLAIDAILGKE